jgi:site-specific recombinase XerD
LGPIPIELGAAADLFRAAKAAEGASPRTVEWYRMILVRAVRRFGEERPVDAIPAAELRAWLLELRSSLAPESIAGYVRGLKAFGNWCAAEEVAAAAGFRALRRPKVPRRLIAVPIGASARRALVRYLATRVAVAAGDPLFCGRWGPALSARGIQLAIARLGRRAAVGTRCSPHTFRHTFARGYLVNGGDVFSLQQILGHATLDMVRRYVSLSEADLVARHRTASPADRLVGARG